jgi:IclR family KDG regulon transcriptional repressor
MVQQSELSTTVAKAFVVIELLASKSGDGLSLGELSKHLGVSKSTAHRYLVTLENLGVVERDASDRFYLGYKLVELTGAFLAKNDLRNQSQPLLDELAAHTSETIHLAVPSGNEVVYISKIESTHSIQMFSYVGARLPMYCTSLGKAILAHYPPEKVKDLVGENFKARTPHTITTFNSLCADLDHIRERGFAYDLEENEIGVCCVGAPVFDYNRKVVGAISASGPIIRMTPARCSELGPVLSDVALRISKRMGYSE